MDRQTTFPIMSPKFKCIAVLAFLILDCYVLSLNARLNIERGSRDIFDNPNCKSFDGVGCNCDGLNASCVDSSCKRCRCSSTYQTFLSSNDYKGRCVKDRHLLFIPNSCRIRTTKDDCCVFPFTYDGDTYTSCITDYNSGIPWCATTSNYDRDDEWGDCKIQACRVRTTDGDCCVFPFTYGSGTYTSCTTKNNDGIPWCATTSKYEDDKWGDCEIHVKSFLVERIGWKCMKPEWSTQYSAFLINKTECEDTDSWQNWTWTRNNQLMHVDTLKCLQEGPHLSTQKPPGNKFQFLVLGECRSTDTRQLWQCLGQNDFRSRKSKLYMYLDYFNYNIYGTGDSGYIQPIKWRRYYSSNETLCSKAFGCYEFVDDSAAILVTEMRLKCDKQCLEEREISVPHKPGENFCFVMWDKLQYLDKDGSWKQLDFKDQIFTIEKRNNQTYLKLDFTKATNNWKDFIVNLQFYCAGSALTEVPSTDVKCVVIKFIKAIIDGKFTDWSNWTACNVSCGSGFRNRTRNCSNPSPSNGGKNCTYLGPSYETMSCNGTDLNCPDPTTVLPTVNTAVVTDPNVTKNSPTTITGTISQPTSAARKSERSSSLVVVIVVCVVVVILIICGILGFIFYKRQRLSVENRKDKAHEATQNPIYSPTDVNSSPFFSGDDETYDEPKTGASGECALYEPACDNTENDYADVEQNDRRLPPQDYAYDYAKSDDVRPVAQQGRNEMLNGKEENNCDQSDVYETLEDPTMNN